MKPTSMILLAALGLASAAQAQKPPAEAGQVRVRASHRVDVIAPGERVETIIERMRGRAPPPAPEAKPVERQSVRSPDAVRRRDRTQSDKRPVPPPAVRPRR